MVFHLKMDTSLHLLLSNCSKENIVSSKDTHYSFFGPAKGWCIPSSELNNFWDKYCELVIKDDALQGKFYLGEKVGSVCPLTALLTFKFEIDKDELDYDDDLYDDNFIPSLVASFQEVAMETLELKDKENNLICVCMKNEVNNYGDIVTMNFRLQFPFCPVEVSFQKEIIYPKIISQLRSTNVISFLSYQPLEQWDKIIDMSFKDPIPLFGSTKSTSETKMLIKDIYSLIENDSHTTYDINEIIDLENHKHVQDSLIDSSIIEDRIYEYEREYYIPMFLSMFHYKGVLMPKKNLVIKKNLRNLKVKYNGIETLCIKFLDILSVHRFKTNNFWMDIGRALHNCFNGDDRGFNLFCDYSVRNKSFTKGDCQDLYYDIKKNNITMKTIAWFAKEDNEEQYNNIMNENGQILLNKSLNETHSDVAAAFYHFYWLNIAFDGKEWFRYEDRENRWVKSEGDGILIRKEISTKFVKHYEKLRFKLSGAIASIDEDNDEEEEEDTSDKEKNEKLIKKLSSIIGKLKHVGFKNSIMKALTEYAYIENFRKIIDTTPDYTGCLNGVIEIVDKAAIFRKGKPEDYITMTTGIKYNENLTWVHPKVERLQLWLRKVFVDKELLHHFYKDCSSFLYGRNSEKIFRIYSGGGNNSKSMIMKLQQQTLGQYACDLPISLITGQRTQSSGPTPELAQVKGTHVGFLAEPDQEDQMKGGTIKSLTGGDRFFARMLNDNGGSIEATFKLVLACNRIPSIVGDKALRNRIRVIPFLSTWLEDAPDDEIEQFKQLKFKIDYDFERKIPDMTEAFLWLMVQCYEVYQQEGLKEPEIVKEMTKKYWEDTDFYDNFIREKITFVYSDSEKKVLNKNVNVNTRDLYKVFKTWFKSSYPNQQKIPAANFFRSEMINPTRLGPQNEDKNWYGITINEEEEN